MNIPNDNPFIFLGIIFLLTGGILILGGTGIISIYTNFSIEKSKKTLLAGIILVCLGGASLLYTMPSLHTANTPEIPHSTELQTETKVVSDFIAQEKGFTFHLQSCQRTGQNVVCFLEITSNDQDKTFQLYQHGDHWHIRVFDNLGNEYYPNHLQLADKKGSGIVTSFLVANLPTSASFKVEKFSADATTISLLEIVGRHVEARDGVAVQFRNVPLSE